MNIITGEFLRVRSHTQGEAFSLTLDLDTPLSTKTGSNYYGSVYTLINCPKAGCEASKDSISIKIKDGENGTYREIYFISRIRDINWIKEQFNFTALKSPKGVVTRARRSSVHLTKPPVIQR